MNGFGAWPTGGLTSEVVGRGRREMGRLLAPVSPLRKGMSVGRTALGVVVAGQSTLAVAAVVGRWVCDVVPLATRLDVPRWTEEGSTGPVWNIFSLDEALRTAGATEADGPAMVEGRIGELKRVDGLDGDVRAPPNPERKGLGTGTGRDVGLTGDTETVNVDLPGLGFERVSVDDVVRRCGLETGAFLGGCVTCLLELDLAAPETVAGRVFRILRG